MHRNKAALSLSLLLARTAFTRLENDDFQISALWQGIKVTQKNNDDGGGGGGVSNEPPTFVACTVQGGRGRHGALYDDARVIRGRITPLIGKRANFEKSQRSKEQRTLIKG